MFFLWCLLSNYTWLRGTPGRIFQGRRHSEVICQNMPLCHNPGILWVGLPGLKDILSGVERCFLGVERCVTTCYLEVTKACKGHWEVTSLGWSSCAVMSFAPNPECHHLMSPTWLYHFQVTSRLCWHNAVISSISEVRGGYLKAGEVCPKVEDPLPKPGDLGNPSWWSLIQILDGPTQPRLARVCYGMHLSNLLC